MRAAGLRAQTRTCRPRPRGARRRAPASTAAPPEPENAAPPRCSAEMTAGEPRRPPRVRVPACHRRAQGVAPRPARPRPAPAPPGFRATRRRAAAVTRARRAGPDIRVSCVPESLGPGPAAGPRPGLRGARRPRERTAAALRGQIEPAGAGRDAVRRGRRFSRA